MEMALNHSYQSLVKKLLMKYTKKEELIQNILAQRDINAISAYAKKMREHLREKIPLNYERCDLDPIITGEIVSPGYKLTKVLIQSMPGWYLPVHLYEPSSYHGQLPALEVLGGHYSEGKALRENQIMCANLAAQGFIVATFDPIGQGERFEGNDLSQCNPVLEHMRAALPLNLLGENLTSLFVWEGMRVLDYICSLHMVDKEKIGVTGQSGGGVQTIFLGALDERISAVSPIHVWLKNSYEVRNGIGDTEQSVFGLNEEFGVEYTDLLWAVWPKKLMINCERTPKLLPATKYGEQELLRLYDITGHGADFSLHIADCGHEISKQTREIAYTWFGEVFLGKSVNVVEQQLALPEPDALACFTDRYKNRSCSSFNKTRLILAREKAAADPCLLSVKVREALGAYEDGYTVDMLEEREDESRFILHTYNNDYIYCRLKRNDNIKLRAVIDSAEVIPKEDGANELRMIPFGMHSTAVKKGFAYDTETKTAIAGFYGGNVVFRRRLIQIVTAIAYVMDLLQKEAVSGEKPELALEGSGQGGLLALCAALYSPAGAVRTFNTLSSFSGYFENRDYLIEETSILPGLVNVCDISDIAELVDAAVEFINPLNEKGLIRK